MNICLISFARLGDTVCKLPSLWALREAYPKANICFVSQAEKMRAFVTSQEVLSGTGLIDSFETFLAEGPRVKRWLTRMGLILRMRRTKWNIGITLIPSYPPGNFGVFQALARYLRYFGCSNIIMPKEITCFQKKSGRLVNLPHVSDNMLNLIKNLGISVPPPQSGRFYMPIQHEEADWAKSVVSKAELKGAKAFVAVSLGANMQSNIWPSSRYASVLEYIWNTHKIAPIFFGPAAAKPEIESSMSKLPVKFICAGEKIGRVAELIRNCLFYLGNDTGLMHLAVSVGLKCVMVSGARNAPGMWEPYGIGHFVLRSRIDCEGCLLEKCVERKQECLMNISVADVLEASKKLVESLCKN